MNSTLENLVSSLAESWTTDDTGNSECLDESELR